MVVADPEGMDSGTYPDQGQQGQNANGQIILARSGRNQATFLGEYPR
jgi:hypothetical protein